MSTLEGMEWNELCQLSKQVFIIEKNQANRTDAEQLVIMSITSSIPKTYHVLLYSSTHLSFFNILITIGHPESEANGSPGDK